MRYLFAIFLMTSSLFTVGQSITVTSPAGGDTLVGGQTYTITWTATNITDSVRIYYRKGSLSLIETVYNTGIYQWTVPATITSSNFGYIRITEDKFNPTLDENDSPFRFQEAPKTITVTFPNLANDTIYSGQANTLTWNNTGNISKVHIYQSQNGGQSYSRISPYNGLPNTGSFSWTPPNSYQSNQFKIKVEGYGAANAQYYDTNDVNTYLKIGKTFDLLTPQPKNLVTSNVEQITWTSTGNITRVDLEYSTDWGPWKNIADSIPNSGTYNWTVPLDSGNSVRLRIVENGNTSINTQVYGFSMSTQPQVITLLSPNGGETFTEGDSVLIDWTRSSNINGLHMELYYSIDSGLTWTFIQDGQFSNSYWWTAPLNVSSSNCLIRAQLNGLASVNDVSNGVFSIIAGPPAVFLSQAKATYLSGQSRSISYSARGGIDTLQLYFSTDNGATYQLLLDGIDGLQQFANVTFPNIQSDSVRLKLQSKANPGVFDVSGLYQLHKYQINQPFNNQNLYQNSSTTISWSNAPGVDSLINLEYSFGTSNVWNSIANSLPNSGAYTWQVPSITTDSLKIRILNSVNLTEYDDNTGYARVSPNPITVTSPNGGEYWDNATFYPITWTTDSNANISYVRLKYSIDGGQTWITLRNSQANTGSYNWRTFSSGSYADVKIRVENRYNGGAPADESDASFNIGIQAPQTVTINSPNGGERYFFTQIKDILWSSTGVVDTVNIEYTLNGGQSWNIIANNELNDGIYSWPIPNVASGNFRIRIYKTGDVTVADTSSSVFSISPQPILDLISPSGGETFSELQQIPITWDTNGVDSTLLIEYSNNGGVTYTTIQASASNTGTYLWTIPLGIASNQFRIRTQASMLGSMKMDVSGTFTVTTPPGTITVTSPNGGEMWPYRSTQDITWTSTGIVGNVDLSYSIDGGISWIGIKNNEPNDGLEDWVTPFGINSNMMVKVEESGKPNVFDVSDTGFQTIDKPHTITITSPHFNGNQTWIEGEVKTISWRNEGIISLVNIYVSNDNGASYALIADSVPNNSQPNSISNYQWTVTNGLNSTNCRIKVEELGDPTVFDSNPLTISDIHTITILNPNGGQQYNGFDTLMIDWQETGLIHTLEVEYSLDNGANWTFIKTIPVSDTSTITDWVVPNISSSQALIRIKELFSGVAADTSDNSFTINSIQKSISFLSIPDTVRFWGSHGLDWTSTGISNFNMLQSLDSGQTWTPAPGVFHNGPNHFNWAGPGFNTTGVMLRVEDRDSSQYFDTSQLLVVAGFSEFDVLTPNGGETVYTDSIVTIRWKHFPGDVSALSHANLHYSIDTGATWVQIASFLPTVTDSTFNWVVPSNLHGKSALIRVEGVGLGNDVIFDLSDNYFFIETAPELTLTAPDSNDIIYSDSTAIITWNSNAGVNNVNLHYQLNGSTSWVLIDSNILNLGTYTWNIPQGINSWANLRVQMTDSNSIVSVKSDVLIKPKNQFLNMIYPNGGEVFEGAQYISAVWDWSGIYQFQWELKLSTDSGITWFNINDGRSFNGVLDSSRGLLPNINSTNCLIAITSFPYGDTSDAVFTINFNSDSIKVLSPEGGSFLGNTTTKITWDTTSNSHIDSVIVGVANVNGGLYNSAVYPNTGSAPLEIPNFGNVAVARAYVRLKGYSISDVSDTAFSITQTSGDTLQIVSPNGGEQLFTGQQVPITWQATNNIPLVDLEYSTDSGLTWLSIINNAPNCGFYLWTVPASPSVNYMIRLSGNTKAFLQDVSDGVFGVQLSTGLVEIKREANMVYPNPVQQNGTINLTNRTIGEKYELYSLKGELVLQGEVSNEAKIKLEGVTKGSYLLRVSSQSRSLQNIVIIQ